MKGHLKHLKFWPPLDLCVTPTGKGPNRPKFCQDIFWPITTSKLSITHFRQNGTRVFLPLHPQMLFNLRAVETPWILHTTSCSSIYLSLLDVLQFVLSKWWWCGPGGTLPKNMWRVCAATLTPIFKPPVNVRPHWPPFSNRLSLNDPLFTFNILLSPYDPTFSKCSLT